MSERKIEHRLAAGSTAAFTSLVVTAASALVLTPILLSAWTPEQFGQWAVVMALYALIVSFDAGHQDLVCRRMILAGPGNTAAVRRIVGSALRAAALIGLIEVSVAICLVSTPLAQLAPNELFADGQNRGDVSICLLLLVGYFAVLGSMGGVLARAYEARGLLSRGIWIGIFARGCTFGAVALTASRGGGIVEAVLAQIAVGTTFAIVVFIDVRRRFPEIWPWWHSGSLIDGLKVLKSSVTLTAAGGSEQFAASALLTMSARVPDPTSTASLATNRTAGNTLTQSAAVILHPVTPEIGRYIAQSEHRKLEAALAGASMLSTVPICMAVLLVAPALPWAYQEWTRGALAFNGTLMWALIAAAVVRQWAAPLSAYIASAGAVRPQVVMSCSRSACTVAVAFALTSSTPDLSSLGMAVLCGECMAALLGVKMGANRLGRHEARLPVRIFLLSAAQVLASMGGLWIGLAGAAPWHIVAPISVAAVLGLVVAQCMALPPQLASRLKSVMRRRGIASTGISVISSGPRSAQGQSGE
jgi:O-antigen/teichoic acid export membrane protein